MISRNDFIKILLLLLYINITVFSYAQEGSPYIINFQLEDQYNLQNWSIIQDESNIMFFANRKGLLTFDGLEWDLVSLPVFPSTIYTHPIYKMVYIGSDNEIGYIVRDKKGNYQYKSIINDSSINIGFINEIAAFNGKIVVLSEEYLTLFDTEDHSLLNQIAVDSNTYYSTLFQTNEKLYVTNLNNNIYYLEEDSLVEIKIDGLEEKGRILFDIPYNLNRILLGTSSNKLLLFDGNTIKDFKIKDTEYLNASILLNGISLSDTSFAVSTLIGGVLVLSKQNGETMFRINYSTGLPDDEIFAVGKDLDNGLWISHDLGISRVDFSIPIRTYDSYPGTEGN